MLFEEIRIMRGPNMWSSAHNLLLSIKLEPHLIPKTKPASNEFFINYFRENYGFEPNSEDFEINVFRYLLNVTALLQGPNLYHDIAYPSPGIPYGVVEYKNEEAGKFAIEIASDILEAVLSGEEPIARETAAVRVRTVAMENSPGPTTSLIIEAARKRNIPVSTGPAGYTFLGYGKNQQRISAAMSDKTSCIGVNIAGNKEHTKNFLESAHIPVPQGFIAEDENDLMQISEKLGFPLVTKPLKGNQGKNVTCGISDFENLLTAFRYAQEESQSVLIEKQITGKDYRLLVIDNKFVAASLRLPPFIMGDGKSSVEKLVDQINADSQRGNGHENVLTKIVLDANAELFLLKQGLTTTSVPSAGTQIFLKSTANLSTGGTAEDVTDLVHPSNRFMAEKVSRVIGLDICGIDVISQDISLPLSENGGAVIEVNAAPGLRMHKFPSKGESRDVGGPIVDMMFKNNNGRIPIVAITGTNGKTTTTRLMAHVASVAGHHVGFSSTDGIFIGGEKIQSGDCSGPQSASTILHDQTVDFAVLECARGGIIRSGLGFDQCDIAIVTNVAEDHLGIKDIHTVEDLANVKSVVAASVKEDGFAILNAGNEHSYAMKDKVKGNVALFCADEENIFFREHIENGGKAVYADDKLDIYIFNGTERILVFNAADVPITRNGKAGFMIENLLPVVLAANLSGIRTELIANALKTFNPSAKQTPGRINEFSINGVNVILDYAHNPHGLRALANYLKNIPAKKLGIITGTGDRRDEDIMEFGRIAASAYDDIIIRFDRDLRGRSRESIVELLAKGMHEIKPNQQYLIIPDTQTAIEVAVRDAEKGSYVVICADDATYTLGLTRNVMQKFQSEEIY